MELLEGQTLKQRYFEQALLDYRIAGHRHPGCQRPRSRTRQRHRSSGHQARQHFHGRTAAQAKILDFGLAKLAATPEFAKRADKPSLSALPDTDEGRCISNQSRKFGGHGDVHVPGTGSRRRPGRTLRFYFSLGIVLYEMATGETPFSGSTVSVDF